MSVNLAVSMGNKRNREHVLRLLATSYPASVDIVVLKMSLDALGVDMHINDLRAHLRYLTEKGYASFNWRDAPGGQRIEYACLTSGGWDILDGLGKDVGVNVEGGE